MRKIILSVTALAAIASPIAMATSAHAAAPFKGSWTPAGW